MRRFMPGVLAILVLSSAAAAEEAPSARRISLTVYNTDLGLVKDVRDVEIDRGVTTLSFSEVASGIDPTSVHLSLDGAEVLEQNYEYDLVSTAKLLEKALDRRVQVFTKEQGFFEGVLLSSDGQNLVLRKGEGGIDVVSGDEVLHMSLPDLSEGLVTRPTLEWLLSSSRAGTRAVEVDYLTGGISWHAEYVGVSDANDRQVDLSGWVSIDNRSGATYPDAELKVVAGDVRRVQPAVPTFARADMRLEEAAGMKAGFEEEAFFEYHLYTLPRKTTVGDRQVKQITLFPPAVARVQKVFRYDGARDPKNVRITLELKNDEASGLGMPLPAGTVRLYKRDSGGSLQFIGEDRIDHTPRDEEVKLYIGNAFDVVGERRVVESRRVSDRVREETVEVLVRNHKKDAATVVIVEHLGGDWRILESTHEYQKKDAYTVEIPVTAKPDEEVKVTFTVRYGRG
jgi:hypothetical protein